MEASERTGKALAGEGGHIGVVGVVEELLDLLFTNGQPAQTGLDPFHRECKQHQQHREEPDSKSLHSGK